ncbi:hypothetical protein Calla_0441 [Caldicellulosiruptor acetigenus 6A]|uniref:Uncharacterized protein n=2 Tax=Caldicellulosiruptor acetigenus TaxID=301953 RepID=G2PY77_9FIRM|nr:hypothetical protein Calla_0441 [Caldicellulosiruptor acetigenus 6A]
MSEIPVYDLSEILKDYYKITWETYTFSSAKKDKFCVYPIYKSYSNILFIMEKSDILGGIIESIIVLSLKNGKVEQTINYKLKNKIFRIIFFDEEKFTLIGYTTSLINTKFGELKIFSIDLIKKEEKLMYSFIVELSGLNENEEALIPFTIYVLALNKRYIMLVNIDINFKNKSAFIVDLYNKSEFYLDPSITDNHSIFEISFAEIKKFKNRDYLFIKTGRISSDEKRYYFNLGKDIINKIETLLIIPCEELIQDLNSGVKPVLSKYLVDKVEYSETLSFLHYGKLNYGFFYSIKNYSQYIDFPSIPYVKENFLTNITDIFSFDLETKKCTYIGSLPLPSEKIRPVYREDNRYFLLYSSFHTYLLPIKNLFIKHYIGTNEISFFELPINIPAKELIEEFYFLKNFSIVITVNPEEKYMCVYSLNNNMPIGKIKYMDEFFSLIVNPETDELNAIIIYPRFLIKCDS